MFGEAANSVGGTIAGLPSAGNVNDVLGKKSVVLLNVEPELDCADPRAALRALKDAEFVVSLTSYKTNLEYADVLLPIAPFTETAGTFVNAEGQAQGFHGVVKPFGDARPAWKLLRVLGNMLDLDGFDHESSEAVRDEALAAADAATRLSNEPSLAPAPAVGR